MLKLYCNKAFLQRQNKRVNTFPKVNGVDMQTFVDQECGHFYSRTAGYFSLLEKDPHAGICEVVYGVRYLAKKGVNVIQKLLVIPEHTRVPLVRNCYYRWGGMAAGFHSYGYDGKGFKCQYWDSFDYYPDFDYIDPTFPLEKVHWIGSYITAETMAELDPSLKYCAYKATYHIRAIDYIRLYRKHPQVCEMLMKLALYRFINEKAIAILEENKSFAFWVARNADKIKAQDMAPVTAFNAWKKNPGGDPEDYKKSLDYRIKCGREASFENKAVYRKALKYASQERLYEYLKEKKISSRVYGDYLVACDWLRLDFADTKVLFPHDFRTMHDEYTAQYGAWKTAQEKKAAKKKAEKLLAGMKATADKFAFLGKISGEGFCVIVAASKEELIDEGAALNHCVGRMSYDIRQAQGESVICFIRRAEDVLTPFVTAEIKITAQQLKVAQCYAKNNQLPDEDVKAFVDSWIKKANKEYRKSA